MKDFYTLFYDPLETSVIQLASIMKSFQKLEQMKDKSVVALPYEVSLRRLDKEELIDLLKFYSNYMESLINE